MDVMIMKKEIKFSLIKTTSKFGDLMKEILGLKKIFQQYYLDQKQEVMLGQI